MRLDPHSPFGALSINADLHAFVKSFQELWVCLVNLLSKLFLLPRYPPLRQETVWLPTPCMIWSETSIRRVQRQKLKHLFGKCTDNGLKVCVMAVKKTDMTEPQLRSVLSRVYL